MTRPLPSSIRKAAHTPGPWAYKRANKLVDGEFDYGISATIDGLEKCIAEAFGRVSEYERPNAEANARLIAAAPDLLATLEQIAILGEEGTPPEFDQWLTFHEKIAKLARAAIARAEGRL